MTRESDEELSFEEELAAYEHKIMQSITAAASFRKLDHAAFQNISYADTGELLDIVEEIRGQIVGDVGSGPGGVAKSAYLDGLIHEGTTVESINPWFGFPFYASFLEAAFNEQILPQLYPSRSPQDFVDA